MQSQIYVLLSILEHQTLCDQSSCLRRNRLTVLLLFVGVWNTVLANICKLWRVSLFEMMYGRFLQG